MKDVDPKLAKELFSFLTTGEVSLFYRSKVNKIVKAYNGNRRECFIVAASLFGEPQDNDQLYMLSQCYVNAGAKYRKQAIEFLKRFIDAGAVWSGAPKGTFDYGDHVEDLFSGYIANIWYQLGKAYEGEYCFIEARQAYFEALDIDSYFTPAACGVSDPYIKMNDLDGGIRFLNQLTKSKYKDMKLIAKDRLEDLKKKKAAGYIYKSRPLKN